MQKQRELYAGKAKSVYTTESDDVLVLVFRNDTSAFDGKKVEKLDRKGAVNNQFNAWIMQKLEEAGIPTHFEALLSPHESLVKRLEMIPLECVVRNISAGSLCRRLGVTEGLNLEPPTFELFLKNDELGDPMVNASQAVSLGWATAEQLAEMQQLTLRCNAELQRLFAEAGILLVDFKLEFGAQDGKLYLGDEFTPDGCRLWDAETREKLDKDRFRQNLGDVVESYELVGQRLGLEFSYDTE